MFQHTNGIIKGLHFSDFDTAFKRCPREYEIVVFIIVQKGAGNGKREQKKETGNRKRETKELSASVQLKPEGPFYQKAILTEEECYGVRRGFNPALNSSKRTEFYPEARFQKMHVFYRTDLSLAPSYIFSKTAGYRQRWIEL